MTNKMNQMITVKDLLSSLDSMPWKSDMYAPVLNGRLTLETKCLVLDGDDVEDGHQEPLLAEKNCFKHVLEMQDIQGIASNCEEEIGRKPSLNELLVGLNYYIENDAYFDFKGSAPNK